MKISISKSMLIGRSTTTVYVLKKLLMKLAFFRSIGAFGRIGITHDFVSWELAQNTDEPRYITDEFILTTNIENDRSVAYLGGGIRLDVDTRKNKINPTSGILLTNKLSTLYGIKKATDDYHQLNSSLAVYHSFRLPAKLTFAARVGWGEKLWRLSIFQRADPLEVTSKLEVIEKPAFYGDESFYSNFEARLKLFSFRGYILPGSIGLLGFHDVGRVWLEGESSNKWHRGVGGGIWLTPFNLAVISAEVGTSQEETLFYIRLGHLF